MADKIKPKGKYAIEDKPLLKLARERWKFADESEGKQAQREIEDLGFYAGDPQQQWGAAALAMRASQGSTQGGAGAIGMPATPERPTLVINKVLEPVRQVQNEIRAADIGVELVPADDFGDLGVTPDETEITLREGLIRRIQRESEAEAARNWAGDRAIIAGRGYYQVATRYLPGKTHYQEVYIHGIYNQAGVKLDPSHEQPDGSDSDWGFVGTWMPWDRFATTYPNLADGTDNPFAECTEEDFIGMAETYPDWYQAAAPADPKTNSNPKQTAVRIVDYWYTERESRELWTLTDGSDIWADEVPEDQEIPKEAIAQKRTVIEKQIKFCKIAGGVMILEETDWPSPEFPIIKVLGEQLQPYDDQRRAIGMVRPARGAQQGFNYMISKLVETVGLTPLPPVIVDPDAIDGYEDWWKNAATRAFYMLPARTWDDQGRQLKEPHRPNVDPNLQPMSLSIGMFDQLIKSTTAVPDPTLGNVDPSLKSGKAIDRVVANAKNSTSNFLDNRVISTKREGAIVNSLLYPIYGQPGRIVQIMTGESQRQKMQISDPNNPNAALMQQAAKVAKLTENANFNIIVKVTKAEESRRQQEAEALGQLISADPQPMMATYGDLYFINSDLPGRQELAARARVKLDPAVQAYLAEKEGKGPTPQMLMQKLSEAQQQIQHAEMAMQELAEEAKGKKLDYQKAIDTAQIKAQSDAQLAQIDADRQIKLQAMKDAATIEAARIAAEAKVGVSAMEAREEAVALGLTQAHDAATTAMQQEHERTIAAGQMAHDAASADMQREHDAQQADQDRQVAAAQMQNTPETGA